MNSSGPKLAVIIPMFNEEMNAERCVREVCNVIDAALPQSKLFVVNDGSSDRTHEILQRLSKEISRFEFISHPKNAGYGASLITGAKQAFEKGYEFGLFMDSDLTNDPNLIPVFNSVIQENKCDLVKASRYIGSGRMVNVPLYHQVVTIFGNKIASFLFGMGIKDCTNGFRAVRLSLLVDLKFIENGFPVIMEELYHLKRKHARAVEIPYTLTARTKDQGASKFRYKPSLFYKYLKYSLKAVLSSN